MKALQRRQRVALLLSAALAAGTLAAIAANDSPRALLRTFVHLQPIWLLWAFVAEVVAYAGYVLAYRAVALRRGGRPLPVMLVVLIVLAGFGPFAPFGGFSLDRRALGAVHEDEHEATVQVLGLGVIEYLLLAPAACISAVALFLKAHRASPVLTLPWIVGVPVGFALAWWATEPRVLERFSHPRGAIARSIGDVLAGVEVMREVVLHPLERWGALVGMGVYWAAEIACFGFALRCFGVHIAAAALVLAYATGYAASRRSLPLGGAGITEALLTIALIAVHVSAPHALFGVIAYRLMNFVVPTIPALLAHSSITPLLEGESRKT